MIIPEPVKKRLSQRPQRHVDQAGQSRTVGAAASGDADASDVRDQKLGDHFGVEASSDIAFPLRIANAGGNRSRRP
jgi:hypothetical protein